MPRHVDHTAKELRQFTPEKVYKEVKPADLRRPMVDESRITETHRQKFGRSIGLDSIEQALLTADRGNMRPITDLARETIDTDPHLASVLMKRFGSVSSLPYEIRPAAGFGVDKKRAQFYAAVVREQLLNLEKFRSNLRTLAWALFDNRAALEIKWMQIEGVEDPGFGKVDWAVRALEWIHPRRLYFGDNWDLVVVPESGGAGTSAIASGKSLDYESLRRVNEHVRFVSWLPQLFCEYPPREGLARRCLYWSFFKRFSARERMILLELFGKPWRFIEVDEESSASREDLEAADDVVDALGGTYTARLPRGTHAQVVQPGNNAGQVHGDVLEHCDKQMSKLVLGQTGTTDGVPAGMNTPQAAVMQDEQLMILKSDAAEISEVVESKLTDAIVEVNFGVEALPYAPRFVLRSDLPADRDSEIKRLSGALGAGLSIAIDEAYEVSGFRIPETEDRTVKIDQPPTPPLSPVAPAPRAIVVYPEGTSPPVGEQQPAPSEAAPGDGALQDDTATVGAADVKSFITVNEARAGQGLPPLTREDGSPDPDGNLTIVEFEAKKAAASTGVEIAASAKVDAVETVEARGVSPGEARHLVAQARLYAPRAKAIENAYMCTKDHRQPETPWGSPETIVSRGLRELGRAAAAWADQIGEAVSGLDNPTTIINALSETLPRLDLQPYARALERRMVHTAALGALDSALDADLIDAPVVAKATPEQVRELAFADKPFKDAIKEFIKKNVVTRAVWDTLTAGVRRRSFTVAGLQSQQMVSVVHDELIKQITTGGDLREFRDKMNDRLKSAGMVPREIKRDRLLGASHIETVERTNVLNAYNAGRYHQATQPEVMQVRPVWEFKPIVDPATRKTHAAVEGVKLLATDPFWQTAYPPYGFNCRCRVAVRDPSHVDQVVSGSTITGLPDPGFVSGVPNIL